MKLAIDCRFIGKSGIGTYIENVVDELLAHHPEHEYLLVVAPESSVGGDRSNVSVLETDIAPFSFKELLGFSTDAINRCDAFFSPYVNIPGRIKIPIYSTIHDMLFFDVSGLVSPLGKFVRRFFYARTIGLSRKVFTVSEFSKQRILHHFPTDKDVVVVYNGVSKSVRTYEQNAEKKDYFIFVGNVKKHKGVRTLVEAFSLAQRNGLESRLLIVGNSDRFRTSDQEIAGLIERNSNIEFTGWVTDAQLVQLVAASKALVQPSLYEGFGIPPLEALYIGTNVILSDIPVFKEVYGDMPVRFFETGNAEMLSELMLEAKTESLNTNLLRSRIDHYYNYEATADTIIGVIARDAEKQK